MTRCLSTKALLRLYAGDGREEQRLHVDTCDVCSRRYQRVSRELETVNRVLLETEEPVRTVAARRRVWVPVSAMATALIALVLIVSNSAVRAPFWRSSEPMPADEAATLLEDVSLTMFSIEDRPAAPVLEARLLPGCEGSDSLAIAACDEHALMDRLMDLFEPRETDL